MVKIKRNSHLSLEERLKITVLQRKGISIRKIAKELGQCPSTISRELKKENALYYRGTYIGSQTHNRAKEAWRNSHKRDNKFLNQGNIKGTVENINGLIRRFFPKGTDFDTTSEEEIAYVEDWINDRPMKIFNYMTPKQKLQHFGAAIAS